MERVYLRPPRSNVTRARCLRLGLCSDTHYLRVRYGVAHYKTLIRPTVTTPFPFFVEPGNLVEPLPSRCSIRAHSCNGPLNTLAGADPIPPAMPRKEASGLTHAGAEKAPILTAYFGVSGMTIFRGCVNTLYGQHPTAAHSRLASLAPQRDRWNRRRVSAGRGSSCPARRRGGMTAARTAPHWLADWGMRPSTPLG